MPNAGIGLMLPSHLSHSQKFMIQFGAVGNKSFESQVTLPTGDFPNSLIMNGTVDGVSVSVSLTTL